MKTLLATSRLVTLTGIGGVGKTRLALRVAAEVAADFPDGVRLVELGELRDASSLMDVVAAGLDLRDEPTRPLNEVLIDFLCSRKLLLVLDNCEHVVDAAAKLAETLLRACPDLRIMATSREALGIGGEAVLPIVPVGISRSRPRADAGGLPRIRRGGVVRRAGRRRAAGISTHRGQQSDRHPDLLPTGWAAVGD